MTRLIRARAPLRICDNGGWTDTWFAGHGRVFHIAVLPGAEVELVAQRAERPRMTLHAADFGQRYVVDPDATSWGPHPLLEAAIRRVGVPADAEVELRVRCCAPPGAGTGTSAAVTVALIGALLRLSGRPAPPSEVAVAAQAVETEDLGRQCGIQDQLCAAHGGINEIVMGQYPHARVEPIACEPALRREIERRLLLVWLGRGHDSSALHQTVIGSLERAGSDCPQLEALRQAAAAAAAALRGGDLEALGRSMIDNTEAQRRLHPALIGADAERVIEIARARGAAGWKVNGAGGEGGAICVLSGADTARRAALIEAIGTADPAYRILPFRLAPEGLVVEEEQA